MNEKPAAPGTTPCTLCKGTWRFYSSAGDCWLDCPHCQWLGLRERPLLVWNGERMVEVHPAPQTPGGFEAKRLAVIGLRIEGLEL